MGMRFTDMSLRLKEIFQGRDVPPAHYMIKLESFSTLAKSSKLKYTSDQFEVGNYKWKLQIHPNGNKEKGGQKHISIYLELVETSSLPLGWTVNAIFNLFVFDQIRDKYFSVPNSTVKRFQALKNEHGIDKFMDLVTFNDSSNGYMVDDTCIFGAEVFIIQQSRKLDVLSLLAEKNGSNITRNHVWKVKSFSNLQHERHESDAFSCGDFKWRIRIYPKGLGEGKGNSISTFLCLEETTISPNTKVCADFTICFLNEDKSAHLDFKATNNHFGHSSLNWGYHKTISLAKLHDPTKGFLEDDRLVIEAIVTIVGVVTTK